MDWYPSLFLTNRGQAVWRAPAAVSVLDWLGCLPYVKATLASQAGNGVNQDDDAEAPASWQPPAAGRPVPRSRRTQDSRICRHTFSLPQHVVCSGAQYLKLRVDFLLLFIFTSSVHITASWISAIMVRFTGNPRSYALQGPSWMHSTNLVF